MTNNQLCDMIGIGGCAVLALSVGLMFFGVTIAFVGVVIGAVCGGICLVNYD